MPASYPSSAKTFTTKTAAQTIDASHVNDLQDEVTAIETDLLTAFPGGGADGGQMKFPATQNASSDANTLDDYEEGTWTPTITGTGGGSGQVYSLQIGRYVKIGQLVMVNFNVSVSTLGTVTTAAAIGGLPFTSETVTNARTAAVICYWGNLTNAQVFVGGFNASNSALIQLFGATAAATTLTALVQGDLANTTQIIGTLTYRAAA